MSKDTLKRYGTILSFDELDSSFVPKMVKEGTRVCPIYTIKESSIENFTNHIIAAYSPIKVPRTSLDELKFSEIDFERKLREKIDCRVCINRHHFIPYVFYKKDIVFFFKPNNQKENMYPFVFIKDSAIEEMLAAEHGIYGLIDMSKGSSLLSESDVNVKEKMNEFQEEILQIGKKYTDIRFMTIGDSVLLRYCFKVLENGELVFSNFNFIKIIKCFREIKESIDKIFSMNCYGVFTYGCNKTGVLESNLENVFHSGILSKEFKLLIYFEERLKTISDGKDMYLTKSLYQSYRFYVREEYKKTNQVLEHSNTDSSIPELDTPDTSELDNHPEIKEATALELAKTPFLIKK